MKLSAFIQRLQELQKIHQGDPDVAIAGDFNPDLAQVAYEPAMAELQNVYRFEDGSYLWRSQTQMPENVIQIIVIR